MVESERGGSLRHVTTFAIVIAALALIGCGTLTLLPRQNDSANPGFVTIKDLEAAYVRIRPGLTRASQLARLGFDSGSANAQVLSYLGVMERFMPRDSVKFDQLDAAVQDCIEARDRCTALVFKTADGSSHVGGNILSAFGLGAAAAGANRAPEVTILVANGRVAFKMISGMPAAPVQRRHIETVSAPHHSAAVLPVAYRTTD